MADELVAEVEALMQQLLRASEDAEGAAALTAMVLSATSGATTGSSFSQACLQSRTRQPPGTFAQPLCPSTLLLKNSFSTLHSVRTPCFAHRAASSALSPWCKFIQPLTFAHCAAGTSYAENHRRCWAAPTGEEGWGPSAVLLPPAAGWERGVEASRSRPQRPSRRGGAPITGGRRPGRWVQLPRR